ncbi:hypothetical protein OOK44_36350 [Streptomyces cellulosae]|uniref:Uncharacterized protein n=1 Tax=Streptomyces althioticus TaxID=83380 RepID=A0ABZ1YJJ4_9ACTN|nr:hypothetical protein [Streptomyces cellulosae]WTB86658.1 hypothetical protein OG837_35880 [Streptomyces cellulosae]WTB93476.1 hypothetical protein OIE99_35100 [Streptomyces cellulosae]WTC60867.1 hypothetical protein OH715_36850 [Streptomyces cellulosae]
MQYRHALCQLERRPRPLVSATIPSCVAAASLSVHADGTVPSALHRRVRTGRHRGLAATSDRPVAAALMRHTGGRLTTKPLPRRLAAVTAIA